MFELKNIDGNEYGPIEQDQIKDWILSGRVTLDYQVKESQKGLWQKIISTSFAKYFQLTDPKKVQKYFYAVVDFNSIKKCEVCIFIDEIDDDIELYFIKQKSFFTVHSSKVQEVDLQFTGDTYEMKVCDRCFKIMPTENFENNREKKLSIIQTDTIVSVEFVFG